MDYSQKILLLIDSENEIAVLEKAKQWNILLHTIDAEENNLLHLAAKRNMLTLANQILEEDKQQHLEVKRIINDQNDKGETPLDLSETNQMSDLIRECGGRSGTEINKENEALEGAYYSAMEDVSKTSNRPP